MTTAQIIGLVVVLILALAFGILIVKKSTKHVVLKWLMLFSFVAVLFTWIFPAGQFDVTKFNDLGMVRLGLTDIPYLIYFALQIAGEKIVYLFVLGVFYEILSKSDGYKKLVTKIATKFQGKEIVFALIISFVITLLTSFVNEPFTILVFIPFIISILLNMKFDKVSALATTFGSLLVGVLGNTYGGEGLIYFNSYLNTQVTTSILYRIILLVVAFVLFNIFNVLYIKKVLKKSKADEVEEDPYKVEKVTKKVKVWPVVVIFTVLFIITILGFISWKDNFNLDCFNKFHTWLMGLKIGKLELFKAILGNQSLKAQFGSWLLLHFTVLVAVLSVLVALINQFKVDEFVDSCENGFKKMFKPIMVVIGVYVLMTTLYLTQIMPTITNLLTNGVKKFNPYLITLNAFMVNIFHHDISLTGFLVGNYLVSKYATSVNLIHFILTSTYGLVQIVMPTSLLLLVGLTYLNVNYKNWFKYIWKFAIIMLLLLIIMFTIIAYA